MEGPWEEGHACTIYLFLQHPRYYLSPNYYSSANGLESFRDGKKSSHKLHAFWYKKPFYMWLLQRAWAITRS